MPNLAWDNASTGKKLEMLRDDVARIFDVLNRIINDVSNTHGMVRANDSLLKEVAKAVEAIEKKLPEVSQKK